MPVYPDPPGQRMAYDLDGSVAFMVNPGNTIYELTPTEMQYLNDEADGNSFHVHTFNAVFSGPWSLGIAFPELRDLVGYFIANSGGDGPHAPRYAEWSADTTNGYDGTWTTIIQPWVNEPQAQPYYRTAIEVISVSGAKAIRFREQAASINDWFVGSLHLYGSLHAGQSPDRLRIWQDPTNAEVDVAYFDWGDVPRGQVATKSFRVKNNSPTLTAATITVRLSSLTEIGSPAVVDSYAFSTDGGTTWSTNSPPSASISDLAPGAISSSILLRKTTPTNEPMGLWTGRLVAEATSFS